ncbi:TetR/AcrR family transcriptional regulator [Nocardia sp. NPDC001965]
MPHDTLTRPQMVTAAITLLDEAGLDGPNMRSLGKRLDSAATAMYWHVENKDNLVRLATDEVWAEVALPDPDTLSWRTAAEAMATGMYRMMSRHPWLVQAQSSYLLHGENKSRHDDHGSVPPTAPAARNHDGRDRDRDAVPPATRQWKARPAPDTTPPRTAVSNSGRPPSWTAWSAAARRETKIFGPRIVGDAGAECCCYLPITGSR